jgi:hypothetical protein
VTVIDLKKAFFLPASRGDVGSASFGRVAGASGAGSAGGSGVAPLLLIEFKNEFLFFSAAFWFTGTSTIGGSASSSVNVSDRPFMFCGGGEAGSAGGGRANVFAAFLSSRAAVTDLKKAVFSPSSRGDVGSASPTSGDDGGSGLFSFLAMDFTRPASLSLSLSLFDIIDCKNAARRFSVGDFSLT